MFQIQTTLLYFSASDIYPLTSEQFQKVLIEESFKHTHADFKKVINFQIPFRKTDFFGPPPHSSGLRRKDRRLRLIFFRGLLERVIVIHWALQYSCGNINVAFLPHSVEVLEIRDCEQQYLINTRLFPRKAIRIDFRLNRLFGPIDLQGLPENLIELDLSLNNLEGLISLFHLPQKIQIIKLRNNRIGEETLFYGNLPQSIEQIDLLETRIRQARPVSKDVKKALIFCSKKKRLTSDCFNR